MRTLFRSTICLLFLGLFSGVAIAQTEEPIEKEFGGVTYELKHEDTRNINGALYNDSYWVSLDGNSTKTILCRIPKKCRKIDLKSLTLKCIKDEVNY